MAQPFRHRFTDAMSIDAIAELWAAGATFTDVGLKLGKSRNVIAGRIDRARKSGDPRFQPRPQRPPARKLKPVGEGRRLRRQGRGCCGI